MKHIVKITKPPVLSGKQSTPDGAICGNGDIGLILGNSEDGMRIYISKCDLWQGLERHDIGGLKPLGYIDIPVPEDLYKNYYVEQDMDNGELRCRFEADGKSVTVNVRPNKTENSVMLETGGNISTVPVLKVFGGETTGEKGETEKDGIKEIYRIFKGEKYAFETYCYAFMKEVGDGKYYLFAATNHDTDEPEKNAFDKVQNITEEKYNSLIEAHYSAWAEFWSKSSFSCENEELELGWYASQYFLAGCTGNKNFAPGLFANFITVENPSWHSDYHLNYNYQAPFYAACSSNHVEFTDCYHAPLEEFFERGKEFAAKWGCKGIMYPVGLMPKAVCSEWTPHVKYPFERLFLGQKSNAIHPADIMVFRWNATKDTEYAREHAYPYIKAAVEFFEDWMTFEKGFYVIHQDAAHEVPFYKTDFSKRKYRRVINDTNNCLTLGLLRMCIPALLEMSEVLGADADKREKWKDILNNLSPYPTYYRFGKKVFRYTKKGQAWNDTNDVGLQHIYPCGGIGKIKSDDRIYKVAFNTFKQKEKHCYDDSNAVCSFYPMAVRLGREAEFIIKKLHELNEKEMLPNMLYNLPGGCLENCSVTANTVNEMILQSFEGIIRVFPDWDMKTDAAFKTLRADGAFLVSSEVKNKKITSVKITCEKGGKLFIKNPYENARTELDGTVGTTSDDILVFNTAAGDKLLITDND